MAAISYFIITEQGRPETLLTPPMVAMLLVANLVPAMALMVLIARRVAMRRAAHSPIGGRGRLHVRLVALFSVIASVPTLLVVDLRLAAVPERRRNSGSRTGRGP